MTEKPLLSICVPTYNRADLLELMLQSLCSQADELGGPVEIVVRDNCSEDRTADVVKAAARVYPISYTRNERNIGNRNLILVVEGAHGEFSWVLGDDDMLIHGALPTLVDTIRANDDLDYFFVNWCQERVSLRNELILEHDSHYVSSEPVCRDLSTRRLGSWEELFDIEMGCQAEQLTGMFASVFRTQRWLQSASVVRPDDVPPLSSSVRSLDEIFPHVKLLAHAFHDEPVYYLGTPCLVMGMGAQEWGSDWPVLSMVGLHEALTLYGSLGMGEERLRRLWRSYFERNVRFTPFIGTDRHRPCLNDFTFSDYVRLNRRHSDLLAVAIAKDVGSRLRERSVASLRVWLPDPVYLALRGGWRDARETGRRFARGVRGRGKRYPE